MLRCQARIGDLYRDDAVIALYSGNSDPKIERGKTVNLDIMFWYNEEKIILCRSSILFGFTILLLCIRNT